MAHQRIARLLTLAPLVALGASFLVALSGCPGGAELEHPDLYFTGGTATGGTGGTTGGTAGTGTVVNVPWATVAAMVPDCPTIQTDITKDCAGLGCHRPGGVGAPSGLILTPDDGFVGRVKDIPALHEDIYCPDIANTCPTIPTACPAPGVALLVNSTSYTESWIYKKLQTATGCGDQMPPAVYDPAHKACVEELVQVIAALPK